MRCLLGSKYRICVKGYGFLSFCRTFLVKYGEKLMNTAAKTGINATKNCF